LIIMRSILNLAIVAFLGLGVASCAALESFFGEGAVVTTADQLAEGEEAPVIPWQQLPDELKAQIPEGTEVVMATKDQLTEEAAYIPLGGELDGDSIGGIIDAGFGIASTFLPGLAAWEGVVTLFSQRKRKNYAKAIKAAVPSDKNIDLAGAVAGVAAALGMSHTSEGSKAAADDEDAAAAATEAVAAKAAEKA
jgi:hypothetical protein